MNATSRVRRKRLVIAGLVAGLLGSLAPLTVASPAAADTPTTHTVRASTSSQSNVAPNGPLTGLVNGSTVTVRVTEAGPADQINSLQIRQCEGGVNIANAAEMGPSNTGYCLDAPLAAGSHHFRGPVAKAVASDTFIELTFNVGVGTRTVAYDDGAPQTNEITCGATSPCSLWIQIGRTGGNDFVHYDLNFLGTPGAPTAVNAVCNTSGANVSWTAPANTGNSTITGYTVTATPTGSGAAVAPVTTSTTSASLTGFTAFEPYSVTVTATNAGGQTGPASAPITVSSCLAGPTLADPQPGAGEVDLSWTFAGSTSGLTGFEVRIRQLDPIGPDQTFTTGPTVFDLNVDGLEDGTLYDAAVRAVYGTNFTGYSNIQEFTPASTLITQTITVRRPAGALVLTQVCSEHTGFVGPDGEAPAVNGPFGPGDTDDPLFADYPYPQDAATGDSVANYPTDCGIHLGPGKLIKSGPGKGQFFEAAGELNLVTVVDTRDVSPGDGWTVNGTMADFTQSIPGAVIVGDQLGWTPEVLSDSDAVTFSDGTTYDQEVTPGDPVAPNSPSGTGLGSSSGQVLGSAPELSRLGIATLGADILLWIPVTARTGNYSGVLTISAI